jgi:hypothetical protein
VEAGQELGDVRSHRSGPQVARGLRVLRRVDLDQEDALAAVARRQGQRRSHQALADTALAREHDQPTLQEIVEHHVRETIIAAAARGLCTAAPRSI